MSKTMRLSGYCKGNPVYSRESESYYRWTSREYGYVRREHRRKYRRDCKVALRNGNELPIFTRTQGWISK
jgi:hypothetical protein